MLLSQYESTGRILKSSPIYHLLGAGVLLDSFGSLAHSMLGELSWQDETDCCLNFTRADRAPVVVLRETRCFSSDLPEDVVDEGVHDRHCLAGDTNIGVYLLEHLVDVDAVRFLSLSSFRLLRSIRFGSFLASCIRLPFPLGASFTSCYHFDTRSIRGSDRLR